MPGQAAWLPVERNGWRNGKERNLDMNDLPSEIVIRMGIFAAVLAILALGEFHFPRRHLTAGKPLRWLNNLALVFLNTVTVRVLLPLGAVGMAVIAQDKGWGCFNNLEQADWLAVT